MRLRTWTTLFLVTIAQSTWGQTSTNPKLVNGEATSPEPSVNSYTVLGATSKQEALVRAQARVMQPNIYPLRILFVLHWKYIDTAKAFASMCPLDIPAPCSRTCPAEACSSTATAM